MRVCYGRGMSPAARLWTMALLVAVAGCGPEPTPTPPTPPPDHTPSFVDDHGLETGCAECHGADPCTRCHRSRPPADHTVGFAGPRHGVEARLDPDRCAACHTGPLCVRCHGQ